MNARQVMNLAYTVLTERMEPEQVSLLDASLYDGALDEEWGD